MIESEIKHLKEQLFSNDHKTAIKARDELVKIGDDTIIEYFIDLLKSKNGNIRNLSAVALRDLEDNRAVKPLFNAIFKPENKNNRGTLVYALQTLDCSKRLVDVFKILLYGNYECKIETKYLLDSQNFDLSKGNIMEVLNMWEECKSNPNKCPEFDEWENEIQNYVEKYKSLLM